MWLVVVARRAVNLSRYPGTGTWLFFLDTLRSMNDTGTDGQLRALYQVPVHDITGLNYNPENHLHEASGLHTTTPPQQTANNSPNPQTTNQLSQL